MKDLETDPQVEKKLRRKKILSCSYCPPHRFENARGGKKKSKVHQKGWKIKKEKQYTPSQKSKNK